MPYFTLRLIQMGTGTKINTFTFYKGDQGGAGGGGGGGGGVNSPQKPKICKKKWRLYVFYNKYHIPDAMIYPIMMWIQIYARGVQNFFLLKTIKLGQYGAF